MNLDRRTIGVDFDNTVVCYDELMCRIARGEGMIPNHVEAKKSAIRDYLRARRGGEEVWQRLQALCYGVEISRASVMPGALAFFRACWTHRVPAFVVSHKTDKAAGDPDGPNLRTCALDWLEVNGFFSEQTGLSRGKVFFGSTRHEKLDLIRSLGCTHFIDDLGETFLEPSFPVGVHKILFQAAAPTSLPPDVRLGPSWEEITTALLARCD